MKTFDFARERLHRLRRFDLATLLKHAWYEIDSAPDGFDWVDSYTPFIIKTPEPISKALNSLYNYDKKKIIDAVKAVDSEATTAGIQDDNYNAIAISSEGEIEDKTITIASLVLQRETLRAVGMGELQIQDVDDDYILRHEDLLGTFKLWDLEYTAEFVNLWDWYHYYKHNLESYAERRKYLYDLFDPLIMHFAGDIPEPVPPRELTGWERVDRALLKARRSLSTAVNEEDYQGVGLLCREILISTAQEVYDGTSQTTHDGIAPSDTDLVRMIEAFLSSSASGPRNANKRKYVKTSQELAVGLQHRRNATFRDAAVCLEATSSIVNTCAILSGVRDPK
ncbi:MAG: hypothetical protein ACTSWQ_02440 [Candidatus Thorarchaeota archaeon]